MREQLRRFIDFEHLDRATLTAIAANAARIRLPERRWLLRPGRSLPGRYYLLEGRVQLTEGDRSVIVSAGSARARRVVYPGAAGIRTLTSALFLRVVALELAGLIDLPGLPGMPEVDAEEASWQRRFLTSPLMERLDPLIWQRVLRAMRRSSFAAGAPIIRAGEAADCCYVLCSGIAEIRGPDGVGLGVLTPGNLFGEDALISGGRRNADVRMHSDGAAMSLEASRFHSWLLDEVVQPIAEPHGRVVIALDTAGHAMLRAPVTAMRQLAGELGPEGAYAIIGGSNAERTLAAFLLAERGLDARPVSPDPRLRPAPSAPGPTP